MESNCIRVGVRPIEIFTEQLVDFDSWTALRVFTQVKQIMSKEIIIRIWTRKKDGRNINIERFIFTNSNNGTDTKITKP